MGDTPTYSAKASRLDDGSYQLSYGKGSKKITDVLEKHPSGGFVIRGDAKAEPMMKRVAVERWEAAAVKFYGSGVTSIAGQATEPVEDAANETEEPDGYIEIGQDLKDAPPIEKRTPTRAVPKGTPSPVDVYIDGGPPDGFTSAPVGTIATMPDRCREGDRVVLVVTVLEGSQIRLSMSRAAAARLGLALSETNALQGEKPQFGDVFPDASKRGTVPTPATVSVAYAVASKNETGAWGCHAGPFADIEDALDETGDVGQKIIQMNGEEPGEWVYKWKDGEWRKRQG